MPSSLKHSYNEGKSPTEHYPTLNCLFKVIQTHHIETHLEILNNTQEKTVLLITFSITLVNQLLPQSQNLIQSFTDKNKNTTRIHHNECQNL